MVFVFDDYEFDAEKLELMRAGKPLKAETLVLRLLSVLIQHAGRLVTKQQLISRVWDDRSVSDNVVTVTMVRLRKLLGHRPNEREFVTNVHGRGYRFVRPVERRDPLHTPPVSASVPEPGALPFVGRERVLERLRAARTSARAGRGSACLLIGEPGIGKTSLVEVLEREAATAGMTVAWGYCRESGGTPPLWPFAQLARDVARKIAKAPHAKPFADALADLEQLLAGLEGGNASELFSPGRQHLGTNLAGMHRIFDGITRALALAAQHTPCLLVLDDLHRADVASLQLLHYWIDELARAPILLLGTMRRSADWRAPTRPLLSRVLGHRNCTRIEIDRLSQAEVASYVTSITGDPTGAVGRAVFAKSEGNPFFMVELSRQLSGDASASADTVVVSKAALDLVRQRVFSLDEAARGVLSSAAVIGRSFELGLLQVVTGHDASALMTCLDEALESDAVHVAHDSRTTFSFAHDLLREALYEALPAVERRRHHLRVALALEARAAAGDAVPAADLAHHFEAALPDSDLRKTVQYCSQAASAAASVCAYPDAVRYLRRARATLELIENSSPRLRAGLALRQASYARACSSAEFQPLIQEALRLARAQRSGSYIARVGFLLDMYPGFPALPGAREAYDTALEYLAPPETATRASVLARLALSSPLAYDAERAHAQVDEAFRLCEAKRSVSAMLVARFARLYLLGGPGHEARAAELLAEIEALCAEDPTSLSFLPVLSELQRSISALQAGDFVRSDAALERCEGHCRTLGSRELVWHAERFRVLSRINAGHSARELSALQALHRRAARDSFLAVEIFCAYDRSVVLGDASRASRDHLRKVLSLNSIDAPNVWALKVRGLAAAGLRDEARTALRAHPASELAQLPRDRDHLGTLGALARAAISLRAREYIEAIYPLLAPYPNHFAVNVSLFCEGSVAQLLGMLAQALGRHDEAVQQLQAAIAIGERAGFGAAVSDARSELHELRRSG